MNEKRSPKKLVLGAVAGALGLGLVGYAAADALDATGDLPSFLTLEAPIEVQTVPEPRARAAEVPEPASALDESAPRPTALVATVEDILSSSEAGDLGIEIRDALSNEVLYARGEDRGRTPASVTKVLTGAAALLEIGGEERLSTSTEFDPATATLTLRAGGDPLLGAGESRPSAVNGRAGLRTLAVETAQRLQEQGIGEVALRLDTSRYSGPDFHSGWSREDIGKGIITPIQPLMIDTGYLGTGEWRPRSEHPAEDAFAVFSKELGAAGITVTDDPTIPAATAGTIASPTAAPALEGTVAAVESATISELVEYALVHSDNVVAEVLGREVAIASGQPGTAEAAPAAVLAALEESADLGQTHLEDTSGLTYANRISPHDLTGVLQASVVAEDSLSGLLGHMPVGGLTGTLSTRFTDDEFAAGLVHAKTGTLSTVTSLAGGVLDRDGRYLVFTLQVDEVKKGETLDARKTIDDIVTALANCGCR
ncbi:D-alanyl-D-alanine carboxypeptidase/D-alanyl-D-alanine-endopeptidase (penicillin-binding protein 4) [Brevibacterium sanguinis]|uniref:D-alanyl-D-alanine carboxypeptidase/D-alanyl-D-alanine-endopeptidase (Penicillin-binding protein 4) n=2 Tax=Brevibacterium TaxID=1696 RepID=A0A366IH34_9MICO|nr:MULTISPECIES: D-alanyl-D-alanine carboxypeptidase [Brevibacterium]RBP63101.1 D-alanyl-D-alanine carboxypeptidase/D-alanyl-D-alanine-endopeptidase (penicillin-binding protein 4) [Brevibacterium sanguinis]RBP69723.1 D-alanyl-D-alanine carboxypeptidase/D-alanyl-D-alanine-endopeptidase (penicillin-binding protein 4) [Brevibacterium celere]